jgi:hypothetical protein
MDYINGCIPLITLKCLLMKPHFTLRNIIVVCVLFLITYALAEGIKNANFLSITTAMGSMIALFVCVHLFGKLVRAEQPEEEEA